MAPKSRNDTLTVVSPTAMAVEQAKSDIKRGVWPRNVYDRVIEEKDRHRT